MQSLIKMEGIQKEVPKDRKEEKAAALPWLLAAVQKCPKEHRWASPLKALGEPVPSYQGGGLKTNRENTRIILGITVSPIG